MHQLTLIRKKTKKLKYAFLCAGIGVLIVTITIVWVFNYLDQESVIDIYEQGKSENNCSLSIDNPVFEGVSDDQTFYTIAAEQAYKNSENEYTMNTVSGKYVLDNGEMQIKSLSGVFDKIDKKISLENQAKVIFQGAELKSSKLLLDIMTKDIISHVPVVLDFHNSQIRANQLKANQANNIIEFTNGVESSFYVNDFE
ncbi:MAG: LPS export ABC transporter periplasmic protein LptC [Rickettsiaceae bacterium]